MDNTITVSPFYTNDSDLQSIGELYCLLFSREESSPEDIKRAVENINKHTSYEGFQGFKAKDEDGRLAGFAYDYQSFPGQFYREKPAAQLTEAEIIYWLKDCFEFVELVVEPSCKRRGIGSLLHDRLMMENGNEMSVLTTWVANQPAIRLYEKKGWQLIKSNVPVVSADNPQVIMGCRVSNVN